MSELRYKYFVGVSKSSEAEDLEELLNEKGAEGWELFMLHEVDSRMGKTQYNCIFYKVDDEKLSEEGESVEITDTTDFKSRIEKIYQKKDTYDEYKDIQQKIISAKKRIKETKASLESATKEDERENLNNAVQEEINNLNDLEKQLAKISDASNLYERIKSNKISICLSEELIPLAENNNDENLIARNIKLRQDLTDKYAYVIPNLRYTDNIILEPFQYRIDIREVPAASGFVYPEHRMFYKGQANITRKPKGAIIARDPIYMLDVYWIKEEDTTDYWDQGMSPVDVIAQHLKYTCMKHCTDILDYKDVNHYIDLVRKEHHDLAENLIPEVLAVGDLRYILASLIKESVPVHDIVFIFEKIMDAYSIAVEKEILLENLRVALSRQISYSKADENNQVYSIVVHPSLDKYLTDHMITPDHSNPFIEIGDEQTQKLMQATAKMIETADVKIDNVVVMASPTLRQALFAFYENHIPSLSVMSYEELSNEVEVEEIGTLMRKHITVKEHKES